MVFGKRNNEIVCRVLSKVFRFVKFCVLKGQYAAVVLNTTITPHREPIRAQLLIIYYVKNGCLKFRKDEKAMRIVNNCVVISARTLYLSQTEKSGSCEESGYLENRLLFLKLPEKFPAYCKEPMQLQAKWKMTLYFPISLIIFKLIAIILASFRVILI